MDLGWLLALSCPFIFPFAQSAEVLMSLPIPEKVLQAPRASNENIEASIFILDEAPFGIFSLFRRLVFLLTYMNLLVIR